MAVFGKNGKKEAGYDNSMARNHLAQGTRVKGEIESEGSVRIDGEVIGTIISKGKVVIGQQGKLVGDILNCSEAEIEGKVSGNIKVEGLLSIRKTGVVVGDVDVKDFVNDHGVINGKIKMPVIEEPEALQPKMNGQMKNKKVLATAN